MSWSIYIILTEEQEVKGEGAIDKVILNTNFGIFTSAISECPDAVNERGFNKRLYVLAPWKLCESAHLTYFNITK